MTTSKGHPAWNKGMKGYTNRGTFKKGHVFSEEIKKKISKSLMGRHCSPRTEFKKDTIMNGRTLSEAKKRENLSKETRKKMSISKLGNKSRMGMQHTKETRKKMSKTHAGKKMPLSCIIKRKNTMIARYGSEGLPAWNKGEKTSEETKRKLSIAHKKTYEDPIRRISIMKKIIAGCMKRPTSYEKKIIDLCAKHELPFGYVGDGKVIINYVNPDFINTSGKKQLIEVYHDYFKIKSYGSCEIYEEQRTKRFLKEGFETLFLDDSDIHRSDWESHCLKIITSFLNKETLRR